MNPTPKVFALLCIGFLSVASVLVAQRRQSGGGGGGGETVAAPLPEIIEPKARKQGALVYPFELAMAGTEGSASVRFKVSKTGEVTDITVRKASKPEFGKALVAAIQETPFSPAMDQGKAVNFTKDMEVNFSKGMYDAAVVAELKKEKPAIYAVADLDGGALKATRSFNALFPQKFAKGGNITEGKAEVEVVIDKLGVPRMPRVVSATQEEFGWAASTAVLYWSYAPPKKDGQPVYAKVLVPMEFKKEAPKAPAKK